MFTQLESGAGLDLVLWIQSMQSSALDTLALALDFLGSDMGYIVLVLLLYWSVNRHLGRRGVIVLIISEVVVTALKMLFATPRPYEFAPDRILQMVDPGGGGVPSGHVAVSLALMGYIVLWLNWRRGWWFVALYIALMGWSRMYTGAHYPQDLVAGVFTGLAIAFFCYRYMDTFAQMWAELTMPVKGALIVGAALILSFGFFEGETGQMILGIMLGGTALVLEERYIRFDANSGGWLARLLRVIIGLVLAGIAYYGLKMVFEGLEPAAVFRVIRYGFIGALVMAIYPWLCVRAGVMRQESTVSGEAQTA